MNLGRSRSTLLAAIALCATLATACETPEAVTLPANATPSAVPPSLPVEFSEDPLALRFGMAPPSGIIPAEATDPSARIIADALFDGLTAWRPDGQVVGAAASGWTSDRAGRVWTFTLRADTRYHDGTAVTAADFKVSWERAVRRGLVAHHLEPIEGFVELRDGDSLQLAGVQALDDQRLQVRLRAPLAEFPAVVAHPALAPLSQAAWTTDAAGLRVQPVGNGPFRIVDRWAQGQPLRVERFEGWRNGRRPALSAVVFEPAEAESGYIAFQQGTLDVASLPVGALQQALTRYRRSPDGYSGPGVLDGPTAGLYYLGFDTRIAPLDDPEVRRAVSLAIDREVLAQQTFAGELLPVSSAVPAPLGSWGTPAAASPAEEPADVGASSAPCTDCARDSATARAIFAARGIRELPLWFNTGGGHEPVARRIIADLAAAGVLVRPQATAPDRYLDLLQHGRTGVFRFGWTSDYPLLDDALRPLLHSRGTVNFGGYRNPRVDALLDRARATLNRNLRVQTYQMAEELALDTDSAIVPLLGYRHHMIVADRVSGFVTDPLGSVDLTTVSLQG